MEKDKEKYFTKKTEIKTGKDTWSKYLIEIYTNDESGVEIKCGEYERNYSSFMNTFVPFIKNGKEYALYSKEYETTSVMSLPDCKHIADTESGFCPVDFYVPDFKRFYRERDFHEKELKKAQEENNEKNIEYHTKQLKNWNEESNRIGTRGLVSGCVWGDDSGGWKVQMIDLSEIENGKISLSDEMGYFQLPSNAGLLKEIVEWDEPYRLSIPLSADFQFSDHKEKSGFLGYSVAGLQMYKGEFYDHYEVIKKEKEVPSK